LEFLMDAVSGLLHGFAVAFTGTNLLWALVGVTLGTAVGVLPGIGPALTVALLLPATGKLDPVGALLFAALFSGLLAGGLRAGRTLVAIITAVVGLLAVVVGASMLLGTLYGA
jgi:putative tricarboxylic transport membrane protein